MKTLLATLLAALPLVASAQNETQTYTHPTCRYSFRYPAGWKVTLEKSGQSPCELTVQPAGKDKPDEATVLWLDGGEGGFETAAEHANLQAVTWYTRAMSKAPKPPLGAFVAFNEKKEWRRGRRIEVGPLEGVRVDEVVLACSGGPCSESVAFLTGGLRWVILQGPSESEAFELALNSISGITPQMETHTDPFCGYSFRHPVGWAVTKGDTPCVVHVSPAAQPERELITVEAGRGGFDSAAKEAGFTFVRAGTEFADNHPEVVNSWVAYNFAGYAKPTRLRRGSLYGLRSRTHDKRGSPSDTAFLTDGRYWLTISGPEGYIIPEFDLVLKNLRLILTRH